MAGLTLLAHIIVMVCSNRKFNSPKVREIDIINNYGTTDAVTANAGHSSTIRFPATSSTHYSLQNESEVDDQKFVFVEMDDQ